MRDGIRNTRRRVSVLPRFVPLAVTSVLWTGCVLPDGPLGDFLMGRSVAGLAKGVSANGQSLAPCRHGQGQGWVVEFNLTRNSTPACARVNLITDSRGVVGVDWEADYRWRTARPGPKPTRLLAVSPHYGALFATDSRNILVASNACDTCQRWLRIDDEARFWKAIQSRSAAQLEAAVERSTLDEAIGPLRRWAAGRSVAIGEVGEAVKTDVLGLIERWSTKHKTLVDAHNGARQAEDAIAHSQALTRARAIEATAPFTAAGLYERLPGLAPMESLRRLLTPACAESTVMPDPTDVPPPLLNAITSALSSYSRGYAICLEGGLSALLPRIVAAGRSLIRVSVDARLRIGPLAQVWIVPHTQTREVGEVHAAAPGPATVPPALQAKVDPLGALRRQHEFGALPQTPRTRIVKRTVLVPRDTREVEWFSVVQDRATLRTVAPPRVGRACQHRCG